MSDTNGPSVEDEIVRDTSRALGQVMAVARQWIKTHRGSRGANGVPKLSRKERRDLAESIRVQVGEQKIAAAWYTKRVNDYRGEVVAAQIRRDQPGYTRADAEIDQARLAGIRYQIESTLHETQALPLERRGQVAMALSEADRTPHERYGAIFRPMDREQERAARSVAVQSETWVAERRNDNARLVAEQRAQAAKRAEERRQARPPRDYEELTRSQRYSVQDLRATHLGVDRSGKPIPADRLKAEQEQAKGAARFQGLTEKEIGQELAYMAENTIYCASYGDDEHRVQRYYPHRDEALAETIREMGDDPQLAEQNVFTSVQARPDGLEAAEVERRAAFGSRSDVRATLSRWGREPAEQFEHVGTPHEVAVARIEPGTGRVLHSEVATLRSEQAALDFAHRGVTEAGPGVARMRVEITDPDRPEIPRYHDYGLPRTLANSLSDLRVSSRERLLSEAEYAKADMSEGYVSLEQRHRLSIEHNAELTDRNGDLTRQLATMIAERDQALADRDRFRGERDEAVRKVAAMTPAKERYGSPQRQASAARAAAATHTRSVSGPATSPSASSEIEEVISEDFSEDAFLERLKANDRPITGVPSQESERRAAVVGRLIAGDRPNTGAKSERPVDSGRSALADYQPGNALAAAMERQTEREGVER